MKRKKAVNALADMVLTGKDVEIIKKMIEELERKKRK